MKAIARTGPIVRGPAHTVPQLSSGSFSLATEGGDPHGMSRKPWGSSQASDGRARDKPMMATLSSAFIKPIRDPLFIHMCIADSPTLRPRGPCPATGRNAAPDSAGRAVDADAAGEAARNQSANAQPPGKREP